MNWIIAWIDLEDGQVRIRNTELNGFIVQGGYSSHKSIKQSTNTILIATVFSFYFSSLFLMGGLLHYIAPSEPSWSYTCWSFKPLTWVHVPSDTLFGFWWVVIAKAALFKGLLHINAAKKVDVVYLMRW